MRHFRPTHPPVQMCRKMTFRLKAFHQSASHQMAYRLKAFHRMIFHQLAFHRMTFHRMKLHQMTLRRKLFLPPRFPLQIPLQTDLRAHCPLIRTPRSDIRLQQACFHSRAIQDLTCCCLPAPELFPALYIPYCPKKPQTILKSFPLAAVLLLRPPLPGHIQVYLLSSTAV